KSRTVPSSKPFTTTLPSGEKARAGASGPVRGGGGSSRSPPPARQGPSRTGPPSPQLPRVCPSGAQNRAAPPPPRPPPVAPPVPAQVGQLLPCDHFPDLDGEVPPRRRELLAVAAEGKAPDAAGVPAQGVPRPTGRQVPEHHRGVLAPRGEHPAVRAERQGEHRPLVRGQAPQRLPCGEVPQLHVPSRASPRQDLPLRVGGQAADQPPVRQDRPGLPRGGVAQLDLAGRLTILRRPDKQCLAVGGDGQLVGPGQRAAEGTHLLAGRDVPQPNRAVSVAGG